MARTKGALGKKTIEKIKMKIKNGIELSEKEKEKLKYIKSFDIVVKKSYSPNKFTMETFFMTQSKKRKRGRPKKITSNKTSSKYKVITLLPAEFKKVQYAYEHHCKTTDSYTHVWEYFFVREKNDEYVFLEKDKFIRTGIYRGMGVTKEKLLNWLKKYNESKEIK